MIKSPPVIAKDMGLIPRSEDPLEKEMAAHSGILAWRIPWTEEPGYSPRGRTRLSDFTFFHFHFLTCCIREKLGGYMGVVSVVS